MLVRLRTVLVLLACAALGMAGLLAQPAAGRPTDGAVRAAVPTTVVTLKVVRCNGCTIRPVWYPAATEPERYWKGPARTVRDGVVRFTVAREHTHGLAFRIHDPRAVRTKGRPIIVIRYDGHRVGHDVTAAEARTGTVGWHCYAGTTRERVTLRVTVDRFAGRDYYDGTPGHKIRAYADPTARYLDTGYQVPLRSGIATSYDAYACGR